MIDPDNGIELRTATIGSNVLPSLALLFMVAFITFAVTWRLGPIIAVAASVVLALVVVVCAKPESATAIVVFALYTNIPFVLYSIGGVPIYMAASVLVLILIPLLYYILFEHRAVVFTRPFLLLLVYLVAATASAVLSANAADSAGRLASYMVEGLLVYWLFTNTIRSLETLRRVIWILILAGLVLSALTTYQGFTKNYQQTFGGLAQVQALDEETGELLPQPRAAGPIGETNRYAQVLLMLLPLTIFRWMDERSRFRRAILVLSVALMLSAIAFTFSRGAGVAAIFMLLLMRLLGYINTRHVIVTVLLVFLVLAAIAPVYLVRFNKLGSANDMRAADGAIRGRATENLAALKIFCFNPVFGVGPGQAPKLIQVYGDTEGYRRLDTSRRAHNMYLEEMAETGIVGFTAFMAVLITTLSQLERARRYFSKVTPEKADLAASMLVALATYMCSALFLHLAFIRYHYLLLALAGVTFHLLREEAARATSHPPKAATSLVSQQ